MSLPLLNIYKDGAFYKCNVSDIDDSADDTTPYFCGSYIDTMISKFQYIFNKLFM